MIQSVPVPRLKERVASRLMPCIAIGVLIVTAPAFGAAPKPSAGHSGANETKGQGQLAGGNGVFGTVYSLKNGFNFEILSARYSVDPFICWADIYPDPDQKMVILDIAVKNAHQSEDSFGTGDQFSLVDEKQHVIDGGKLALESEGGQPLATNLKPGQGLGQPQLKDPLRVAFVVPAKARITKIIVGQGRLNTNEDVFRYYIAGATKEEAGADGNPKNIIAPLRDEVRDPADKSGAVALDVGNGVLGAYYPSKLWGIRLDGFTYTTDPVANGSAPDDGKKYAVASVTAKNLSLDDLDMGGLMGGLTKVTDTDGEDDQPVAYVKSKLNETADHTFSKGSEYSFRIVFSLGKNSQAKMLILGTDGGGWLGRGWKFDVSNMK